jgi:hypothetical protein
MLKLFSHKTPFFFEKMETLSPRDSEHLPEQSGSATNLKNNRTKRMKSNII